MTGGKHRFNPSLQAQNYPMFTSMSVCGRRSPLFRPFYNYIQLLFHDVVTRLNVLALASTLPFSFPAS